MAKKIIIEGIDNRLIKICPACGYSFNPINPKSRKQIKTCPMCGYKFIEPDIPPYGRKTF